MSTHEELALRRMHSQRLWGLSAASAVEEAARRARTGSPAGSPPLETPEGLVRHFGAMQAQEFAIARWSIAQRVGGLDAAVVDRAIADGTIVRTHILRPTWHFVAAADLRWLMALSAPRVHAWNGRMYRQSGLAAELLACTGALLRAWLGGGDHLTRKEIAERLDAEGIVARGFELAYILMHAELEAIVCSGPPRGKQQTYAAFDLRVPPAQPIERGEALAELVRRYFTSHGPATVKDFVWWSGLTGGDCRRGLDAVGVALESEVVAGRTYWSASSPSKRTDPPSPRVDLVQGYDEDVVAYSESKDVFRVQGEREIAVPYLHAILLDGRVIGHWRPTIKKAFVEIETQLYRPLAPAERVAVRDAADRYARFVGVPARLPGELDG